MNWTKKSFKVVYRKKWMTTFLQNSVLCESMGHLILLTMPQKEIKIFQILNKTSGFQNELEYI